MEYLINNTYAMSKRYNDTLKNIVKDLGFKHIIGDKDDILYSYKFPLHKYKKKTVLECELIVECDTGIVRINVYDGNGEIYPYFYALKYGNAKPMLDKINTKILTEFEKLGIKKIIDGNN